MKPENFTVKRYLKELEKSSGSLAEAIRSFKESIANYTETSHATLQHGGSVKHHNIARYLSADVDDIVNYMTTDQLRVLAKLVFIKDAIDGMKATLEARGRATGEVLKRVMDTQILEANGKLSKAMVVLGTMASRAEFKMLFQARVADAVTLLRETEHDLQHGLGEYDSVPQQLARTTQTVTTVIQRTGNGMTLTA